MNTNYRFFYIPGSGKWLTAAASALMLGLGSCTDYFLDSEPKEYASDNTVIVDVGTAQSALLGVYDKLQSSAYYGGDGYQAMAYLAGGDKIWVGTLNYYNAFPDHSYRSDNTLINNVWTAIFKVTNGANNVIDKVGKLDSKSITDAQRKQFLGEAYMLRALACFDLARAWGNVPVVLRPTSSPKDSEGIRQQPKAEVFAQVLADLDEAENLLPNTTDRNRITRKTVYAFKARVHLYNEAWEKAEAYASRLIEDPAYALVPWSTFVGNKNTQESIFELAFTNLDNSAHFGSWSSESYRNQFCPSESLYNLVRDPATGGDRSILIKNISTPAIRNYFVQQLYWRPTSDNPTYLFRLAEQYLIRAEARARKATPDPVGALADLNAVRKRANVPPAAASSAVEVLRALENERQVEFALEPHRWFDLVRTRRAGEVLGVTDSRLWIFPIPYNDLAADKDLEQNPGY